MSDREILEARAVLMREIEAGRVTTAIDPDEAKLETRQRDRGARLEKRKRYCAILRRRAAIKRGAVPRPGEIALKEWYLNQAVVEHTHWRTVFRKYKAGKYPGLLIRIVNPRLIFVKTQPQTERKEG